MGDHVAREIDALAIQNRRDINLIVLGHDDRISTRLAAIRSGAIRYLLKPVDHSKLSQQLHALSRRYQQSPFRVLLINHNGVAQSPEAEALKQVGLSVQMLNDPLDILDVIDEFNPDIVVVDIESPEISGPELATVICDLHPQLPILFLSDAVDFHQQLQELELDDGDYLCKPVEAKYLIAAVTSRAHRSRQRRFTQQRLEQALYEQNRIHQALNHHAIVSITDSAGYIIYINQRFCDVSGYEPEDLLGHNHRLIKSDRHPPEFYRQLWQTISKGEVWHGEVCNRRKDGQYYWVDSTITPFLDESGRPYLYVSIRTDITKSKRLEDAARIHSERLSRSQVFANIGTWDWNMMSGELFWSERIAPLFGYPQGELETTYENFLSAVHEDDRDRVTHAVNSCVERGVDYNIEHRVVWPDGTIRWVQEKGGVIRDDSGNPQHMLGVVIDIHDRKVAQQRLAESENQLLNAQKIAHIGSWQADMRSGELQWSDEIFRIFGYEPRSFLPTVDRFKETVHPDDRDLVLASEKRAEKSGYHDVVHRIIRPDGEIRYVHELAYATFASSGEIMRLSGTVQDISRQVEVEQELVRARDAANHANRAKSEFLSSMSHELRTPMNAILGFAQVLEYDQALNSDQHDSMGEITKAGHHLLELINEVLDLAKVESGKVDLSLEPVEVCPLVHECLSMISTLAEDRQITMTHHREKSATVRADRTRLKQILLNLLSNAIKYNRPSGRVEIRVAAHDSHHLRIIVADTGWGIDSSLLEEIFEPFNRLEPETREVEGTGIGLTITKKIVELMGGSIGVDSELGVGTTFWVDLPIDRLPQLEGEGSESNPFLEATESQITDHHLPNPTILYIEDNPANLKLVAQILGQVEQIHLVTAHTPEIGLDLAKSNRLDLILLDIHMPGMDGYQVLEIIRKTPLLQSIPVIAITANAMPRDIQHGLAAGFDEYLTKPLDVANFRRVVGEYLAKTR